MIVPVLARLALNILAVFGAGSAIARIGRSGAGP